MKMRILGVQSGTALPGQSGAEYVDRQIEYCVQQIQKEKPYLVMFPEMMTGHYFGLVVDDRWFGTAESFYDGPTTAKMLKLSKEQHVHVCYSLFERDGQDYYNTMGLISPTRGVICRYRKIHIPGGDKRYDGICEKYYFKSGVETPVVELDNGIRVAMMLCYDRSFPELWRTYYLKHADLICVAACTMGIRYPMFIVELQTRALESHSFVLALNRAGTEQVEGEAEPRKHFGRSLIADPLGNLLCSLEDESWSSVCGEVDTDRVAYARGRLNWERDRHPEAYENLLKEPVVDAEHTLQRGF